MVKKRRRAVYSTFPASDYVPVKPVKHRSIFITAGGYAMLFAAHKQECEHCRKRKILCNKGVTLQRELNAAVRRAAWKEPQTLAPVVDAEFMKLGPTFNPRCRHDRTAYSIAHCPACIAYVPPEADGN